ncbi:hypothetical protein CRUP_021527, partial [Coryphaenoides rupestris]
PVQPVQVKKSKKKAKAAVPRPVASVLTGDVKETDEGRKGDSATNGGDGGGRADVSLKPPGPSAIAGEREKWSSTAARHRAQPEAKLWGQEKQ